MLLPNFSAAKDLETQVNRGGDFGKFAQRYSIDGKTKAKGGDLGPYRKDLVIPEVDEVSGRPETRDGQRPDQDGRRLLSRHDHRPRTGNHSGRPGKAGTAETRAAVRQTEEAFRQRDRRNQGESGRENGGRDPATGRHGRRANLLEPRIFDPPRFPPQIPHHSCTIISHVRSRDLSFQRMPIALRSQWATARYGLLQSYCLAVSAARPASRARWKTASSRSSIPTSLCGPTSSGSSPRSGSASEAVRRTRNGSERLKMAEYMALTNMIERKIQLQEAKVRGVDVVRAGSPANR